jgi:hypothetical protein
MPEKENIPEQPLKEDPTADPTVPDSTIFPLDPQSKDMEVHHHPDLHHSPKPWKEYFLEFIMIFLAVTLGFFAETIREHISENGRAKELAESLYKEVNSDSVNIQNILATRAHKEEELDFFINYMRDSSFTNVSDRFYRSFAWSFLISSTVLFEPADGMLNQLRNSGSLRYFKNNTLQSEIGELSVSIAKVRSRMAVEFGIIAQDLRPFAIKFYDFRWNEELTKNGSINLLDALISQPAPTRKGIILNMKDFNRLEAENIASYYRLAFKATKIIQLKNYVEINHKLLETLREEYQLE